MAIWKSKPIDANFRSQIISSPKHPGNPKWVTNAEWRKQREPSFIEVERTLEPTSRSFGLDDSSWGTVNQDADGSGWGTVNQDGKGNDWGSSSAGGSGGW
jgi:hypothetical protein